MTASKQPAARASDEIGSRSAPADIVVVGAGPAGLFASGFAAKNGARVLLLEKGQKCGMKILITGKGRCNVTNSETDLRRFVENYKNGRALLTAIHALPPWEVVEFFESRGLKLQTERGGRIFPDGAGAWEVNRILQAFIADAGVALRTDCGVTGLNLRDGRVASVQTVRGEVYAEKFIITTGGLSYPKTGGTGDGYRWAVETGHRLVTPEPALVPVKLAETWTGEVNRFNLKNVHIAVRLDGKKIDERFGEAFFLRFGIGGPIILDMSSRIREALKQGKVQLVLDIKPAVERTKFDKRLQREFAEQGQKDFCNSLAGLLPRDMIPLFVRLSEIDPNQKCHAIAKLERKRLLNLFKELVMNVTDVAGFARAIVTTGGVSLKDIDMRTMRSRLVDNLYFAGEMIDVDGRTGGFNLQACWSTGYLAGVSAFPGQSSGSTRSSRGSGLAADDKGGLPVEAGDEMDLPETDP